MTDWQPTITSVTSLRKCYILLGQTTGYSWEGREQTWDTFTTKTGQTFLLQEMDSVSVELLDKFKWFKARCVKVILCPFSDVIIKRPYTLGSQLVILKEEFTSNSPTIYRASYYHLYKAKETGTKVLLRNEGWVYGDDLALMYIHSNNLY